MVEQGVTLRIQWLPLFYDNRILKAIFCDYGEIMDIRMCKSPYANIVAMYGMRKVTLRTTELSKQRIPHFVTFDSGQSLLITMQGMPLLCLKCRSAVHIRKDGTLTQRRSCSQAMQSDSANDVEIHSHGDRFCPWLREPWRVDLPDHRIRQLDPPLLLVRLRSVTGLAEPVGQASGQVADNSVYAHLSGTEMSEERVGPSKRALKTADDWITPNETAKSKPWSESPEPTSSNPYSHLIISSGDLGVDDSLPL